MKTAILVMSDPDTGSEEALGRVFNALAAAHELDRAGEPVSVRFHGTGTRWPALLEQPSHPAHDLYDAVRHTVAGVSCGCADVFGAQTGELELLRDNPIAGTSGLASVSGLLADGYTILTY